MNTTSFARWAYTSIRTFLLKYDFCYFWSFVKIFCSPYNLNCSVPIFLSLVLSNCLYKATSVCSGRNVRMLILTKLQNRQDLLLKVRESYGGGISLLQVSRVRGSAVVNGFCLILKLLEGHQRIFALTALVYTSQVYDPTWLIHSISKHSQRLYSTPILRQCTTRWVAQCRVQCNCSYYRPVRKLTTREIQGDVVRTREYIDGRFGANTKRLCPWDTIYNRVQCIALCMHDFPRKFALTKRIVPLTFPKNNIARVLPWHPWNFPGKKGITKRWNMSWRVRVLRFFLFSEITSTVRSKRGKKVKKKSRPMGNTSGTLFKLNDAAGGSEIEFVEVVVELEQDFG